MAPDLLSNTIIWPLLLGALLAGLLIVLGPRSYLLGVIAAAMILAIYILLEGWPAFPPLAAKQKLTYLLATNAVAVLAAIRLRLPTMWVAAGVLLIAFVWLGWNRLFTAAAWSQSAALILLIAVTVFAGHRLEERSGDAFLWPGAILCFTAGGAVLSLLGAFVGFAQVLGAIAAWLGGFLLIRYGALLIGGATAASSLPRDALLIILVSAAMLVLMIGLFAPNISFIALIVLTGSLLIPCFAPAFGGFPPMIKPLLSGLMVALPAALSVLIALQQTGAPG